MRMHKHSRSRALERHSNRDAMRTLCLQFTYLTSKRNDPLVDDKTTIGNNPMFDDRLSTSVAWLDNREHHEEGDGFGASTGME